MLADLSREPNTTEHTEITEKMRARSSLQFDRKRKSPTGEVRHFLIFLSKLRISDWEEKTANFVGGFGKLRVAGIGVMGEVTFVRIDSFWGIGTVTGFLGYGGYSLARTPTILLVRCGAGACADGLHPREQKQKAVCEAGI
jgi:hypothetical protein